MGYVLEKKRVDAILLDVHLPAEDGVSFLYKLRFKIPHIPVLMISASSSIRPVREALELGAFDYLRKPFDIKDLYQVLERMLKQSQ